MTLTILEGSTFCICDELGELEEETNGLFAEDTRYLSLLRLTILTSIVTWSAFAIGLAWGIVGVAAAYAIARWILVVPEAWITSRAVSFAFKPTLLAGGAIIPLGLAAAGFAFGCRELLVAADVAPALRVVLCVGALLGAYLLLLIVVLPALVADVRSTIANRSAAPATS